LRTAQIICQQPANIRADPDYLPTEIARTKKLRRRSGYDPNPASQRRVETPTIPRT
jgi:hypothetical protein